MNYKRAIKTAIGIWIIGVLLFLIGSFVPLLDNPELQANLLLAVAFLPLGWLGARYYYKGGKQTSGVRLALVMVTVAVLMDAIITVPIFFLPRGITHAMFFGTIGFWLLILEYAAIVLLYAYFRRKMTQKTISL